MAKGSIPTEISFSQENRSAFLLHDNLGIFSRWSSLIEEEASILIFFQTRIIESDLNFLIAYSSNDWGFVKVLCLDLILKS